MKHLIPLIILYSLTFPITVFGQAPTLERSNKDYLKIGEHVLVKLKNGEKVPGVVVNVYSRKRYYVRQIGKENGQRMGRVHRRFISKIDAGSIRANNAESSENGLIRIKNK